MLTVSFLGGHISQVLEVCVPMFSLSTYVFNCAVRNNCVGTCMCIHMCVCEWACVNVHTCTHMCTRTYADTSQELKSNVFLNHHLLCFSKLNLMLNRGSPIQVVQIDRKHQEKNRPVSTSPVPGLYVNFAMPNVLTYGAISQTPSVF